MITLQFSVGQLIMWLITARMGWLLLLLILGRRGPATGRHLRLWIWLPGVVYVLLSLIGQSCDLVSTTTGYLYAGASFYSLACLSEWETKLTAEIEDAIRRESDSGTRAAMRRQIRDSISRGYPWSWWAAMVFALGGYFLVGYVIQRILHH